MSKYPRIGSAKDRRDKWTYLNKRGVVKSVSNRPACSACGAEATHVVEIQVNWFRGDDEQRKACMQHKDDAHALLKLNDPIDPDEELQLLMDRDMGDSV